MAGNEERSRLIIAMFAAYPNSKPTKLTYATYLEVLSEVPTDELAAVVRQCLSQPGEFAPSAGTMLENWRVGKGYLPRGDATALAWLSVLEALRSTPAGKLSDDVAAEAVRGLGGMSALRHSENPGMDRAHFFRLYEELARGKAERIRDTPAYRQLVDSKPQLYLERKEDE